jgi:hypothetical protein
MRNSGVPMNFGLKHGWFACLACTLGLLSTMLFQKVIAFDPHVSADLNYSRNALLKQRSELEGACEMKAQQITQLQSDIDRLHTYLKDTDRALSNIDIALRGN